MQERLLAQIWGEFRPGKTGASTRTRNQFKLIRNRRPSEDNASGLVLPFILNT